MWSSWPWVSTRPTTSSSRSAMASKPGRIRSTPGMMIFGEQHAAVDQQQLAAVLQHGHVAADVPQPAQRDDPHRVSSQRRRALQATGGHGRQGYTRPLSETSTAVSCGRDQPTPALPELPSAGSGSTRSAWAGRISSGHRWEGPLPPPTTGTDVRVVLGRARPHPATPQPPRWWSNTSRRRSPRCYRDPGSSTLAWTHNELKVMAVAQDSARTFPELRSWWSTAGPYLDPASEPISAGVNQGSRKGLAAACSGVQVAARHLLDRYRASGSLHCAL